MTVRSIILGLCLGLLVASVTYFNDYVVNQTYLIGNMLPISIFGVLLLLTLAVNPLVGRLSDRLPLRVSELAIITAIGLVACGYSSSGFFRTYTAITSLPAHWERVDTAWQSTMVMCYVPGGSPQVPPGHVNDWTELAQTLTKLKTADPANPLTMLLQDLDPVQQSKLNLLQQEEPNTQTARLAMLDLINDRWIEPTRFDRTDKDPVPMARQLAERGDAGPDVLMHLEQADQAFAERNQVAAQDGDQVQMHAAYLRMKAMRSEQAANRAAVVQLLPVLIQPQPAGSGWLMSGGQATDLTDALMQGRRGSGWLSVSELPWYALWSPMRLWWSLFLMFAGASLCLAVILHPKWSRQELLAYPIPRFVEELTRKSTERSWWPDVTRSSMFWWAAGAMVLLHLVNGVSAWSSQAIPNIPLIFNFGPMRTLFPEASQVSVSYAYFHPRLFPSVVAFTFFLTVPVAFSVGLSQLVFMVASVFLKRQGILLENRFMGDGYLQLFRAGTYLGIMVMIIHTARQYLARLSLAVVGGPRQEEVPTSAVWAGRILVLLFVLMVVWLSQAGLVWYMAVLLVLMLLIMMVVFARIVAETGLIMVQAWWLPVAVLTGLFGFEAIGPTAYVAMALASVLLIVDPRESILPYLVNGLQIADRSAGVQPRRIAPWMAVMLVSGFLVAGTAAFYFQFNTGMISIDPWSTRNVSQLPFHALSRQLSDAEAQGTLASTTAADFSQQLNAATDHFGMENWGVLLFGVAVVIAVAVARLRLPWWPIHPILFLVMGTYPIGMFAASFLLGALIKMAILHTTGARGFQIAKPLMVGIIAGELLMGLTWISIGAGYYLFTGQTPVRYLIFPG